MTETGEPMSRIFFYSPHPDDETLSMGLAMLHYLANGCEVHLVSMTPGDAEGAGYVFNGKRPDGTVVPCTSPDHPYTHDPVREGYDPVTTDMVGQVRLTEQRSAVGAMAMITPVSGSARGTIVHHVETLHDGFGAPGQASSTAPVTREGIDAAKAVIKKYVDQYSNSFHFTMSETDDHHDHAACGYALRELKNDTTNLVPWANITYHDALVNARFFVSRIYWENNYAKGQDVLTMPDLQWFNYYGSNYDRYCAWMISQVIKPYRAWNPNAGAFGVGYHQVSSQFANCFPAAGATAKQANLWHA